VVPFEFRGTLRFQPFEAPEETLGPTDHKVFRV